MFLQTVMRTVTLFGPKDENGKVDVILRDISEMRLFTYAELVLIGKITDLPVVSLHGEMSIVTDAEDLEDATNMIVTFRKPV